MPVAYICEHGHERQTHKSVPQGHGKKPACVECSAGIVERIVPRFDCLDCGHTWFYKGDSTTPTCPNCKGKRTELAQ